MAEQKSANERTAEIDKKIEQLKAQKKAILQREKQAARKARTKRLIQIAAVLEAICGEITDLEAWERYVKQYKVAIQRTQEPKSQAKAEIQNSEI